MPELDFSAAPAGQHATTEMEGNGQHGSSSARRNTIAVIDDKPSLEREADDEYDEFPPFNKMKFPWSSPSAPTSPTTGAPPHPVPSTAPPRHRRSLSGSIFSKLNFLRTGGEPGRPPSRDKESKSPRTSVEDDVAVISPVTELKEESAVSNPPQGKTARDRGQGKEE
jgi:hypothetical protein